MISRHEIALVAVDWGTSRLRIWAIDGAGRVVRHRQSDQGMSATARDCFEGVLEEHLQEMGVPASAPAIMCGMVGSRQGWAEAGYLPVPTPLPVLGAQAVRAPTMGRDVRIVPGLSKRSEMRPDVMRGEETQLLGLAGDKTLRDKAEERIVCMPGTHSKWVHLSGATVLDFVSFITGETFSALSTASILSHSVSAGPVNAGDAVFKEAVRASLEAPASILANLFSIRSASLLYRQSGEAARARLSGYLIGLEIADARARFATGTSVDIVGSGILCRLYRDALDVAGVDCVIHDGDALVIEGLKRAASVIWNTELV